MHIHILGICGTFMGGLAQIAAQMGVKVTGCDAAVYPPMSTQLANAGIDLVEGYGAEQLDCGADLFVIGNAVSRGNPLAEAILNSGAPYTSGPQWLSENVLQGRHVLAVAGTHGKTTTASMLAWILQASGANPSFLIGGVPQNFGVSARLTNSKYFVIEADEYDTAFFDKRSKFVHYRPRTVVLNNLEYDHADIFPNLEAIERQFHHLVRTIPSEGKIIFNLDCEPLRRVLQMGVWTPQVSFGLSAGADYQVRQDNHLWVQGFDLGQMPENPAGLHNRLNAAAAVAAAGAIGIQTLEALQTQKSFEGVRRRLEVRGEVSGVRVVDDFAHHPTAIEETIKAARRAWPQGRLIAVLEPRSNTMKLGTMRQRLAPSLVTADLVFALQPDGIEWSVAEALCPLGTKAAVKTDLAELVATCVQNAQAGDTLLVMSNGGFGGIHGKLLDALKAR